MRSQFGFVDRKEWRHRITCENWEDLPTSEHIAHLIGCDDCRTSLWQFLDVRDFVKHESYPCFHVAYYSADTPDRCLSVVLGEYAIVIDSDEERGIVIGFCPWCGINLPTGF
jgi:hypothetical protein